MTAIDLRTADPADPRFAPKLERFSIDVEGKERFYWIFIGKAFVVANPVVFWFAPDGEDITEYAEKSGWLDAARAEGFVVIFPEAENKRWELTGEDDLRFWETVRNVSDMRYKAHNTRQYIGGFKEGAVMAELAILRTAEFVAGMALVEPSVPAEGLLEKAGEQLSTEYVKYLPEFEGRKPILSRDVEQNVAIYCSDASAVKETEEFWKNVGDGKNPCAGVKIFERKDVAEPALALDIYRDFFSKTRRYRIAPNGELRAASDYRDNPNARRFYETMAGRKREWIEVLPSDYSKDKEYPMVIALHGSNNDGPQFYDITRLWEVAEARKFICLFPTASRTQNQYDLWNINAGADTDNGNPDEEFLLELIDRYKKEYGVDASRIYLTGFSNGGGMTQTMAIKHAEIFAAIMPYSGAGKNEALFASIPEGAPYMPVWMSEGTLEKYTHSLSVVSHGKLNWDYWVKRNHLDLDKYTEIDEDRSQTKVYSGAVECRYTMRKEAHHAVFSEHYWDIYDNFFARFRRGADGSVIEVDSSKTH